MAKLVVKIFSILLHAIKTILLAKQNLVIEKSRSSSAIRQLLAKNTTVTIGKIRRKQMPDIRLSKNWVLF